MEVHTDRAALPAIGTCSVCMGGRGSGGHGRDGQAREVLKAEARGHSSRLSFHGISWADACAVSWR